MPRECAANAAYKPALILSLPSAASLILSLTKARRISAEY